MRKNKLYIHPGCSTCKKALKFLEGTDLKYETIDLRDHAPTKDDLTIALASYGNEIKKLFNTSGQSYRNQNIKDKLPSTTTTQALEMLSSDGMLVKRPLLVGEGKCLVGFRESEWDEVV